MVDRLRALGPRLSRAADDDGTPADLAHRVGQRLADVAADSSGRQRRVVPRLADHAAGDQLAVLTADLLAEGDARALRAALAELTALRRRL